MSTGSLSRSNRPRNAVAGLAALLLMLSQIAIVTPACAAVAERTNDEIVVAQADTDEASDPRASRPLEPRYEPREPSPAGWYNGSYVFGMTRGLADSTIHPAAKAPLFMFTIPLDLAFLPFAAIGGLFG